MFFLFLLPKDDRFLFTFLLSLLLSAGLPIGLAGNEKCVSVNHCDQRCFVENLVEKCYCIEGFAAEKEKCVLNDDQKNGSLLFVDSFKDSDFIRQRDLFGDTMEFVVPPLPMHRIFSVFPNPLNESTFFLSASTNDTYGAAKIFRSENGVSRCIFYGRSLRRIAFDWVTENMYYAAKGVGIGACTFKKKTPSCFHPLIPFKNDSNVLAMETTKNDLNGSTWFRNYDSYGDLSLEPQSGRLFWVEYRKDRKNGVIMVAGMDGEEPRVLSYGASTIDVSKHGDVDQVVIRTISIDYARRILYVVQYGRVWSLRLDQVRPASYGVVHVLSEQSINAIGDDVHSILAFDAYFYYMSRKTSELLKLSKHGNVSKQIFKKSGLVTTDWLGLTIRNSAFYKSIINPCEVLACSYMCVLVESDSTIDSASPQLAPRGRCVCRDGAVDMGDGRCVVMPIVAAPHDEVDLLKEKRHLSVTDLYCALNAYRDEMQGDSLGIGWLLIVYSLPGVAVNVGLCASLIHVIVTDYVEYVHLIDQ